MSKKKKYISGCSWGEIERHELQGFFDDHADGPIHIPGKDYYKYQIQLLEDPKQFFWNKVFSALRLTSKKYKYKVKVL